MTFVTIDFETANEKRNSPCAIGLVKVENGVITKRAFSLIRPPTTYFNPRNTSIHGIRWDDVKDKPEFSTLFTSIMGFIGESILITHNASFDISVFRSSLDEYNIPYPTLHYTCSLLIARNVWPNLENYRLPTITRFLGFNLKHHDANEDALACAYICLKACKAIHASSIWHLTEHLAIKMGSLFPGGYLPSKLAAKTSST